MTRAAASRMGDHDAGHYRINEDTQLQLVQARDRLALLASLTQPTGCREEAVSLSPAALAHCFSQLADTLKDVVASAEWHSS